MVPWWGILPQQGDETEAPVEVIYTLKRPRKTEFGDRPLPGGVARLFQADSAGRAQLVGEASMDHTPAGEDLRLSAGTAFDLTARRVQTTYVTRRDSTKAGWRTLATADYRVTAPERHRQRRHGGRARGAERRMERAPEQRAGGEGVLDHHALPGEGAGRGQATLTYRLGGLVAGRRTGSPSSHPERSEGGMPPVCPFASLRVTLSL